MKLASQGRRRLYPERAAHRQDHRNPAQPQGDSEHPLLTSRESVTRLEVITVASDRGLCGAFNSNVMKFSTGVISEREPGLESLSLTTAGAKATDYFKRRRPQQLGENYPQDGWATYGQAAEIAQRVSARYAAEEVDEVLLVFSESWAYGVTKPRGLGCTNSVVRWSVRTATG